MEVNNSQLLYLAEKADAIFSSHKGSGVILAKYPSGCCRLASDIFGVVLVSNGIKSVRIACYGEDRSDSLRTHAWVELGRTIVDITCYQFKEWDYIYVGNLTNWHRKFLDQKRYSVDINEILKHWTAHIKDVQQIIEKISSCFGDISKLSL